MEGDKDIMTKSVDQRVVEMTFDNAQFERGVSQTLASLESLDKKLALKNGEIASESMSDFANSLEGLTAARSSIGSTLANFAYGFNQITAAAQTVVSTVGGVVNALNLAGGKRRALNIEQAKFQLQGLDIAWKDIEEDINYGVKDTAYGLDSAAKAASQLSASGVQLGEDMKAALRGISGVAAMTNAEYDEIAHIFTRVAGNGRLFATDLNSIGARGLNAAATLAEALQVTEADVKDMVSKGEIDFQTFANAMNDAFGNQAKKANDTFTGATSNLRAALSRLWAEFYDTDTKNEEGVIENITKGNLLESMRRMALALIPVIDGLKKAWAPFYASFGRHSLAMAEFVENTMAALQTLIFWKETVKEIDENGNEVETTVTRFTAFGDKLGRVFSILIDGLNTFIGPIKDAFASVLPTFEEFSAWLGNLRILNFVSRLRLSSGAMDILKTAFTGFFNVVKTVGGAGFSVINKLVTVLIFLKDAADRALDALAGGFSAIAAPFKAGFESALSGFSSLKETIEASPFYNSDFMNRLREVGSALSEFYDAIYVGTTNFGDYDWDLVSEKFAGLREAFGNLASTIFDNVVPPDSPIRALGDRLFEAYKKARWFVKQIPWETFGNTIGTIFGTIGGKAVEGFGNLLSGVGEIALDVFDFIGRGVSTIVVPGVSGLGSIVSTLIGGLWSAVGGVIGNIGEALGFEGLAEKIGTFEGFLSSINEAFSNSKLGSGITRIGEAWEQLWSSLTNKDGTILPEQAIGDFLTSFSEIVSETLADWNPFATISEKWQKFKSAWTGFGTEDFKGIGSILFPENSTAATILDKITTGLSDLFSIIKKHLPSMEEIVDGLEHFFNDFLLPVANVLGDLAGGAFRILGKAVGFLAEQVKTLLGNINTDQLGDSVSGFFNSIAEWAEKFNSEDFNLPSISEALEGIKTSISGFAEWLNGLFPDTWTIGKGTKIDPSLKESIEDLANSTKSITKMTRVDSLEDFSSSLEDSLRSMSSSISSSSVYADATRGNLSPIQELLGSLIELKDAFMQLAGPLFQGVAVTASDIVNFVAENSDKILKFATTLVALYGMVQISQGAKNFGLGILAFGKGVQNIGTAMMGPVTTAINNLTKEKKGLALFVSFIQALTGLIEAINVLAQNDPGQMWNAVGVLAAVSGILVASYVIMDSLLKFVSHRLVKSGVMKAGELAKIGADFMGIVALGAAIWLAAQALSAISKIPEERLKESAVVLGLMAGLLAVIGAVLGTAGQYALSGGAGLLLFGVSIAGMIGTLLILNIVPWSALTTSMLKLGSVLVIVVGILVVLGKFGPQTAAAAPVIFSISVLLGSIIGALTMLVILEHFSDDVGQAIATLWGLVALVSVLMFVMALTSRMAGFGFKSGLSVIGFAISTAILIFAMVGALAAISFIPKESLEAAMPLLIAAIAMLSLLMVVVAIVGAIITSGTGVQILGVVAIVVGVSLILGALAALIHVTTNLYTSQLRKLGDILLAIMVPLAIMVGVVALFGSSAGSTTIRSLLGLAGAFVGIAVMLVGVAHALNAMEKVGPEVVAQLALFVSIFSVLIVLVSIAGSVTGGLLAGVLLGLAAVFAGFGVGVFLAAQGVVNFITAIEKLGLLLPVIFASISRAAGVLAKAFDTTFRDLVDSFAGFIAHLASRAPEIAENLKIIGTTAGSTLLEVIANNMASLGTLPMMFVNAVAEDINTNHTKYANNIATAMGNVADDITTIILPTLEEKVLPMMQELCTFIEEHSEEIGDMLGRAFSHALRGSQSFGRALLEDELGINFDEIQSTVTNILAPYFLPGLSGMQFGAQSQEAAARKEANTQVTRDEEIRYQQLSGQESAEAYVEGYESGIGGLSDVAAEEATDTDEALSQIGENVEPFDITSLIPSIQDGSIDVLGLAEKLGISPEQAQPFIDAFSQYGDEASFNFGEAFASGKPVEGPIEESSMASMDILIGLAGDMGGHAVTKLFDSAGMKQGQSASSGFEKGIRPMAYATQSVASKLKGSMNLYDSFYRNGLDAAQGLINGLKARIKDIFSAGEEMGKAANMGNRKGMDEDSPSKLFYQNGMYAGLGLVLGMNSMQKAVYRSGESVGSAAVDGVSRSLDLVAASLDGVDWDSQPVIRPVLDTSDVERGVFFMNSLFATAPTRQAAMAYGRMSNSAAQNQNGVQYNISMALDYNAGDSANDIANGIVHALTAKLNLEG